MKRMSFSATIDQMRSKTKTVTRRNPQTWKTLAPGDRIQAIEKAMGLAKGENQIKLGVIEIVSNELVPFGPWLYTSPSWHEEARLEGFGNPDLFLSAWLDLNGSIPEKTELVRRIEFRHINNGAG